MRVKKKEVAWNDYMFSQLRYGVARMRKVYRQLRKSLRFRDGSINIVIFRLLYNAG